MQLIHAVINGHIVNDPKPGWWAHWIDPVGFWSGISTRTTQSRMLLTWGNPSFWLKMHVPLESIRPGLNLWAQGFECVLKRGL